MRGHVSHLRLSAAILSMVLTVVFYAHADEGDTAPQTLKPGMKIVKSAPVKISQPLRSLEAAPVDTAAPSAARTFQDIQLIIPKTRKETEAGGMDASIVQSGPIGAPMPAPAANFEGVNNVNGVLPPDTQGDIGWDPATNKKYYVQWVNLSYRIWDVTNPAAPVSLVGPIAGNTLWTGTGTICASHNDGDPLTRFDNLSKRWVMSQFALGFPNDFHQCIAVSKTADPTGQWYLYDFQTSTSLMNDYGKLGVWPDGYYMTFNQFGGASPYPWEGAGVAVFERDKMLLGQAARMIYIDIGAVNQDYSGMLPSDLDGSPPPAGSPNYFVEWDDSTWQSDPSDTLRIWNFHTDWANPANTTFGLNASYDPNLKIITANVDPDMCGGSRNCIPQPDTTQRLDAISDRLMYRLQYRNFGTHQTLVGNHTVDASGSDQAGVHWFELRNTGDAGFVMHQEGVYAPAGTDNRWMASAAMDRSGDIAVGYSVSSASTHPSVRYTGRLSTDTLGTLPFEEATLIAGTGSQLSSSARWGDYSMMAVDPKDGCTFWYTQEYVADDGIASWQTRIGAFRFPSCTAEATGTLSGTVTSSVSAAPIAGATVEISGGYSTVTNAAGHYSIPLVSGTYDMTVSKYGYVSGTATGVLISPPATTTLNFSLPAASLSTISGIVRDATASWPLYARIDIAGYPGGPVFTNPVTGAYSVNLANGSYTFSVTAMSGGYTPLSKPVDVSAFATENFLLAVNGGTCSALGYQLVTGATLLTDDFDTSTAPAFSTDWGVVDVSGTAGNWLTSTASAHPSGIDPHSAANMAVFNSYSVSSGSTRLYRTGGIDLSAQTGGALSIWMYHDTGYSGNADTVQMQVSTDAGSTWNNVGAPISRYSSTAGWVKHTDNITAYTGAGMSNVRIGFLGTSAYGNDMHIDDMAVTAGSCTPIASTGLVIGAVTDANTGAVISNATVKDVGDNSATMIDSSADHARPARMYVIAQAAGVSPLHAEAPAYDTGYASPTVVGGGTVGQNFQLAAGKLAVNPTSLSFTVTKDAPTASKTLSLVNSGGVSVNYEIFPLAGVYTPSLPTGPFADNTRHMGPKNLNDRDASNMRVDLTPTDITPLAAGDVSKTITTTGVTTPWGIGFNTDAGDFWISNIYIKKDYRFTTLGVNTGDIIDVSSWVDAFAADMTYNPFTNTLWQVNVGGDNCIYELNPASKISTGNKICPPFGTSQRGLAFDPVTNTYYSGSWNDGIINHFAPDGTILDSASVGLSISGLAFNPGTGHLFAMTNTGNTTDPSKFDLYILDTKASYSILGGFNLRIAGVNAFADYHQAGLELDCSGNLWAVNQGASKVYVASSGETGVCDWPAGWLSVTPSSGGVAAHGTTTPPLSAAVNASALPEGVHNGYIRVENSSPYGAAIVPVTLTVKSKLTVTKSGTGTGTVASSPAGISCGADCTEQYLPNSVVSLNAVPATFSTFNRWSGNTDCADGVVTMNTSKTCNAVFTITPIRIPDQYTTIQAAYNALLANGSIQSQIRTYPEQVKFNRPITAILSGGYIPDWTAATGMTTIQGSLTIEKGTAIVSNLIIK